MHLHILQRDVASLGDNLRKDCVCTLPVFDIRNKYVDMIVGSEPQRHSGSEPDLTTACKAAAVKKHRYTETAARLRMPPFLLITGFAESSIHQALQIDVYLNDLS